MKRKYLYITVASLLYASTGFAQYDMDLRKSGNTPLTYLDLGNPGPKGKEIRVNNLYMEEGGKPIFPVMGEFHYVRMDHRYWRDALLKMKASGIDMVSTYVMWSFHEEEEGVENWSGDRDLRRFVELCAELDLKVHLRAGPYCNAEIKYGGLPEWIVNNKSLSTRSNDEIYLNHARQWYKKVYKQVQGLLHKDGGPIMALQIENEFVKPGIVISHLMNLKNMAVEAGFDVPVYSMTHWMDSEYPKGEIVPYAGFYLETPWVTNNGKMTPPTNFEYFTYNRLSDNIGTDLIKVEGGVESFDGSKNDSPFFTCEIGVGSPTFYKRRPVVDEGMAGENISLRLGTGANLMGYYMYVGGTNPRGLTNKYGIGPYFGYDYQAPIREFGTLGTVMKETKKLNYFMNEFGPELAPLVAYLPITNKDRDNLQWAVRTDGSKGYLFVSNHLYRYDRNDYKGVQFKLKLRNESLTIPRQPVTVVNKSYFLWPFNLNMDGVNLKYGTAQPITVHESNGVKTYFFFEDDQIATEYLIDSKQVKAVSANGAKVAKEKGGYFVDEVQAGRSSMITIEKNDGTLVKLVTLTEEDSDYIWKGEVAGFDFVAITKSSLVVDDNKLIITDEKPDQQLAMYTADGFTDKNYANMTRQDASSGFTVLSPMHGASWIQSVDGHVVERVFDAKSLSEVEEVVLRFKSEGSTQFFLNGVELEVESLGTYNKIDLKPQFIIGKNELRFQSAVKSNPVVAQVEVLYKNGVRKLWNTDETWSNGEKKAVAVLAGKAMPAVYAEEEHLGLFEIKVPDLNKLTNELRLEVDFEGDVATAYIGSEPFTDRYHDGSSWILGLNRHKEALQDNSLLLRIKGFVGSTADIFLEEDVDREGSMVPKVQKVVVKSDYSYTIN
ncbi:beta-galactosidase [Sphingobacterium sp. UT-1RO-CII-1]|uniref:beta-galactosidase n=1 Tax=Sphingobacterium sp. UT-1RO-CII-1 TaxID=2995225 RepID=UPI00227C6144|nr:beta-galactosidase [Sphingobacterium sp. UT-1RO-CII-1]MCY4780036.1 beta-galactosidase [Sphingobacterium sp. UT-1RO-CII-1]